METNLELFLRRQKVLSLATLGVEGPHVCPLLYAFQLQPFCFICISQDSSRHVSEIKINPKIALSISSAIHQGENMEGIQAWGKVELLGIASAKADLYYQRFPDARTHVLLREETIFLEIHLDRLRWIESYKNLPLRKEWELKGTEWIEIK